jgi:hypothetical protein
LKGIPTNDRLEVHVKNSKDAYNGRFYFEIPPEANVESNRLYLIIARVGSEREFPCNTEYPNHKRCEKYKVSLQDWKEAIIFITAHEGEHLRQHVKGKRAREDKAQRRAYLTLMKYRAEETKKEQTQA